VKISQGKRFLGVQRKRGGLKKYGGAKAKKMPLSRKKTPKLGFRRETMEKKKKSER